MCETRVDGTNGRGLDKIYLFVDTSEIGYCDYFSTETNKSQCVNWTLPQGYKLMITECHFEPGDPKKNNQDIRFLLQGYSHMYLISSVQGDHSGCFKPPQNKSSVLL